MTSPANIASIAAGTELFDPATAPEQTSYTQSPNVVTALEFERLEAYEKGDVGWVAAEVTVTTRSGVSRTFRTTATLAVKVFLVAAFLRFALPVLIIGTHIIFAQFLESEHDAATSVLEATSSEIEELNRQEEPKTADAEASFMERVGAALLR